MIDSPLGGSLAETPESQRYRHVLDGGSVAGAQLGQGITATKKVAGRMFRKFKGVVAEGRQASRDRKAIQSGEVKDIR